MKDVRFIWGKPQEDSFMKLKELATSAPVLILPNNDVVNSVLLPSIALHCLPGCHTKMFNCSGILY
jgi:hypothetical protein